MFRILVTIVLVLIPIILFLLISAAGGIITFLSQLVMGNRPLLSLSLPLWRGFNIAGAVVAISGLAIVGYGMIWGWRQLNVNHQELSFHDLPAAFDGYRIVQLSDLHIGTYGSSPEAVERIVREVNALHPDLIVFTGDLVNLAPSELDPFMHVLPRMKARDGVLSIMGNHDYCPYMRHASPRQQQEDVQELQRREHTFGWQLLNNDNHVIRRGADSIAVVGVENSSRPPFPDFGDLHKAQHDLPQGIFKILLSHDPTHWRRAVLSDTDVQLQLSGHTHATQFRLFGWSPAGIMYDEWGGHYVDEASGRQLFICTGTGGNVPFRFGVSPEIVEITLRKQ